MLTLWYHILDLIKWSNISNSLSKTAESTPTTTTTAVASTTTRAGKLWPLINKPNILYFQIIVKCVKLFKCSNYFTWGICRDTKNWCVFISQYECGANEVKQNCARTCKNCEGN